MSLIDRLIECNNCFAGNRILISLIERLIEMVLIVAQVTEHVVVETTEFTTDGPHDPKLDAAATKIQANYKGYKTRKVIKTTTTTTTHSN